MLLGIRWGSLRTKILVWSLVPAAVILGAVALVTYLVYQQGTGEQWWDLLASSPHYSIYPIALLILGLLLPTVVVAMGVRRLTRPVEELIDAASRVADGDLGYTIQVDTGDEIEELATQFNRMSKELEASYSQLELRVAVRTRELEALNAIAAVVSQSLDLDEILDGALDKTLDVMGIEAGGIYLLNESTGALSIAAQRGLSARFVAGVDQLQVGEGFSGRVVATGQPLVVRDLFADPRLTRMVVREEGLRSVAIVPLRSKGRILGTFFAMTYGLHEFTDQNVQLLSSIAHQIGLAVDSARLFQTERRRAEQARVITEVGHRVTSILDIEEVLVEVVHLLQSAFDYDHVGIAMIEGDSAVYKVGAGPLWNNPSFQFEPIRLAVGGEGITGWVASTGEPLLVPDVSQEPRYVEMSGCNTRSELIVPITLKDQVIGVLDVQSEQLNAFDESDLTVLQSLASQAAVAIENARLFDAEQRRAEQFRVMSEVGQRMTSILDVDQLLTEIVSLIRNTFGYYLVDIALIEGDDLVVKAGVGDRFRDAAFHPPCLKVDGTGIMAWVARHGEPRLAPRVTRDPHYLSLPDGLRTRSELAVPLKTKTAIIGVLDVQSDRPDAFDGSDLVVLRSLADQAAVAIENARLYEQARQLAVMEERQRLARELHDAVTQTLFSASLISEALPDLWDTDQQEGQKLLGELRQLSRGALAEMRTLLLELRPAALVEADLGDLLRQLGEAVAGRTGAEVRVSVEGRAQLPPDVHVALYRIAQEALNNVVKHAKARNVQVRLCRSPLLRSQRPAQRFTAVLEVRDDGHGFDPDLIPTDRLGMGIIRERAEAIAADLEIETAPGQGTRVAVDWSTAGENLAVETA
jgi:nitrate/nitrite-specific signal transduction histidine kinase